MKMFQKIQELIDDKDALVCVLIDEVWSFVWGNLASHAGIFREPHFSSLPMNACSTEDNIPFPLFYLRGKWPINSCEIKCWQAEHD